MIFSTALWSAVAVAVTGVVVLWLNPRRAINRTLFSASLHGSLWLLGLHLVFAVGQGDGWLRFSAVLMAFLPAHIWLIKDVIVRPAEDWRSRFMHCRFWLVFGVGMSGWALSNAWGPSAVSGYFRYWNFGYLMVMAVAAVFFLTMAVSGMQGVPGVRRIELQSVLLGGISGALVALSLIGLGQWLAEPMLLELMPLLVATLFAGTARALTSIEVLDTRHILSAVSERLVLVACVVLIAWSAQQLTQQFVHPSTAYVLSLTVGLWFAAELHPWLRNLFRHNSRQTKLRQAAFEIAGKELRPEAMEDAFVRMLKDRMQTGRVVIMMGSQSRLAGGGVDLPIDSPAVISLQKLRWLTPERLERQRGIAEREALQTFLSEHQFAVVVTNTGHSLSFAIGLGLPLTQRPFTHPEVTRLMDVALTIENALARARYLKQAQHAEQLATVGMLGASIAHEIRNPLVSIKTFVQLLPNHYQDAAFREKFFRLIGDEVGRIDRLTEQLLDLSAPRVFSAKTVKVHDLLKGCVDLLGAKAEDKRVKLITDFQASSDLVHTDPDALKQVILNLSFNAIQALERREGERWIRLETTKHADTVEVAVVDSGPGIAPEVWARLFQPFQTTKSSGFGLGLAICKDILSSLHANISADPPVTGRGATFRIILPCPPPTS